MERAPKPNFRSIIHKEIKARLNKNTPRFNCKFKPWSTYASTVNDTTIVSQKLPSEHRYITIFSIRYHEDLISCITEAHWDKSKPVRETFSYEDPQLFDKIVKFANEHAR